MTKKIVVLLAAAFVAGSCASMPGPGGRGAPCSSHICQVAVSVDDACHIKVDPVDLPIAAGNQPVIQWDVSGAEFAANGIEFKQSTGRTFGVPKHGPRRITIKDNHDRVGVTYPYNVRVVQGDKTCSIDPTIMN